LVFPTHYYDPPTWRHPRLFQIAPISTNLVLAFLAEHVLGMPRSY
jgi:acyl-CoA dehydrogenase